MPNSSQAETIAVNKRDIEYLSERIGRLEKSFEDKMGSLVEIVTELKIQNRELKVNLAAKAGLYGVLASAPGTVAMVIALLINIFNMGK